MIIFGSILDDFVSSKIGNFYLHTNFAYLVFSYWVFACPEKIGVLFSIIFGLTIDLISGSSIGFHVFMYLLFAYFIHMHSPLDYSHICNSQSFLVAQLHLLQPLIT